MRQTFLLPVLVSAVLLISCAGDEGQAPQSGGNTISLTAGKNVRIEMQFPMGSNDSLHFREDSPVRLVARNDNFQAVVSAMLVPGCGSTAVDRMEYLDESQVSNLDTARLHPRNGIPAFTTVVYVKDDSSIVERVWSRGRGEVAVLQIKSLNTSLNILLNSLSGLLSSARLVEPGNGYLRSADLSSRTREQIVQEVNADVTVSPAVTHNIALRVRPAERTVTVVDSLEVDFSPTQADSQIRFYVPDTQGGSTFRPIRGRLELSEDSALCIADTARVFSGIFRGEWNGFTSSSLDSIITNGIQISASVSFQGGMWFYPGCGNPAAYSLQLSVPEGTPLVYAPLIETERTVEDSVLTVSYVSPIDGVKDPLAWAAGGFSENPVSQGRSRFICWDSDSASLQLMQTAQEMTDIFWNNMDFQGARLDLVVVRILDYPVFIRGPGCVFLSRDMLDQLSGYETWTDSIIAGKRVPATSVVFETARAFLRGSTYLSPTLRDVLASWSVYLFASSGDPEKSMQLREAFLKYYLYSTEEQGGTEYAIADPLLRDSHLYEAVIMGKAPLVVEWLIHEIPAFQRAIPRALRNLRHAGDSFGRLFSAMGIRENSAYGEMFHQWLYTPGVPQMEVQWADSSGILYLWLQQYQPGQEFPLGSIMDQAAVYTSTGSFTVELNQGPTGGFYTADLPDLPDRVRYLDLDPEGLLPADIVYRHRVSRRNEN